MKKVIFVCTGSTCRSPMAEQIFKHKLKQKNISAKEIVVSSAGIMANVGESIAEHSLQALKTLGIKPVRSKAKQLNKKMVNNNTVIITMTSGHKEWLKNLPNVYALSEFESGIDIPDPIGQPIESYVQTAKILNFVLDEVLQKILNNEI